MLVCRVLGPISVTADGVEVDLGGRLPRRLLAALVAADGSPVPDDRLAEAVWGDQIPARAAVSLQVYVSRLRNALGADAVLERTGAGYLLRLDPGSTDLDQFERGVERGRKLLAQGHAQPALESLTDALDLWRGEAFADLAELDATRSRVNELREVAVEERLAARLATGDAAQAVTELDAAVREHPYRERRWALLILGLYRTARQGDALAALRKVRRLLGDELGVDPGQELQDLERRVLAQDPDLFAATPRPAPVGRPLSSFLGRERELAAVADGLDAHRLVTLAGPAGVGKTRLAVEYATGRADVWLVRLADVHDPGAIAAAVARDIGLDSDDQPRAALVRGLRARAGLLVLDNCEHLVAPVADLVLELLTGCPELRVLTTSRESLGIDGECVLPVEPLPDQAALDLLVDRIRTVRPGWAPSADDLDRARQVCVALDGLPLALELAAARARMLGVAEIAERLDDRFALLGAVPRGSLTPHATLREAVAWSIDQLDGEARALLLRLWPFEGGFPLEAALEVGAASADAVATLSSLVVRSVVVADTTMTPARYRLLETLRAYCEEHDPDPAASRAAHAAWVRELAAKAAADLLTPRGGHAIRVLNRERPNLHAGLAHDLEHHPEQALRTIGLLNWFWTRGGQFGESLGRLEAALAAAVDAPVVDRARALAAGGNLAILIGDLGRARHSFQQALDLIGDATDPALRAVSGETSYYRAMVDLVVGDFRAAEVSSRRAMAIGAETGVEWLVAGGQMTLGAALVRLGQVATGEATLVDAAAAAERSVIWCGASAELVRGQSILHRTSADHPEPLVSEALTALRRALRWYQREDDTTFTLTVLRAGVVALTLAGRPRDAVALRAAVHRHSARLGRLQAPDHSHLGMLADHADPADSLTPDQRTAAAHTGRELDWPAMIALLAT